MRSLIALLLLAIAWTGPARAAEKLDWETFVEETDKASKDIDTAAKVGTMYLELAIERRAARMGDSARAAQFRQRGSTRLITNNRTLNGLNKTSTILSLPKKADNLSRCPVYTMIETLCEKALGKITGLVPVSFSFPVMHSIDSYLEDKHGKSLPEYGFDTVASLTAGAWVGKEPRRCEQREACVQSLIIHAAGQATGRSAFSTPQSRSMLGAVCRGEYGTEPMPIDQNPFTLDPDTVLVNINVMLDPRKWDGRPWDADESAPDIAICSNHPNGTTCVPDLKRQPFMPGVPCFNQFRCQFQHMPTYRSGAYIQVLDADILMHDEAGSGPCKIGSQCRLNSAIVQITPLPTGGGSPKPPSETITDPPVAVADTPPTIEPPFGGLGPEGSDGPVVPPPKPPPSPSPGRVADAPGAPPVAPTTIKPGDRPAVSQNGLLALLEQTRWVGEGGGNRAVYFVVDPASSDAANLFHLTRRLLADANLRWVANVTPTDPRSVDATALLATRRSASDLQWIFDGGDIPAIDSAPPLQDGYRRHVASLAPVDSLVRAMTGQGIGDFMIVFGSTDGVRIIRTPPQEEDIEGIVNAAFR